jgi:hypothetical protein
VIQRSNNGWTLDTLAKHLVDKIEDVEVRTQERFTLSKQAVDAALAAAEKAITAAMSAAEKAVTKAETAAEKRFDSVNEFRSAMKDQQSTFADRNQVEFRLGAIEKRIENAEGLTKGISNSWGFIVGAAGVASAIALVVGKFI